MTSKLIDYSNWWSCHSLISGILKEYKVWKGTVWDHWKKCSTEVLLSTCYIPSTVLVSGIPVKIEDENLCSWEAYVLVLNPEHMGFSVIFFWDIHWTGQQMSEKSGRKALEEHGPGHSWAYRFRCDSCISELPLRSIVLFCKMRIISILSP